MATAETAAIPVATPQLAPEQPSYHPAVRWFAVLVAAVAVALLVLSFLVAVDARPGGLPEALDAATQGQLFVIALRLLVPLLILRWSLVGGILAMLVDATDVIVVEFFGPGGMGGHYSQLDKGLDSYYLALEAVVAWYWLNPWARWTALALFVYRLAGAVLFEATQVRALLFVFPNLFENWWLYCVVVARVRPRWLPTSWRSTMVPLLILLVPKMGQEWLLHVAEAQPWSWFKDTFL
ncbi:MAG: hypothetical protein K1X87_06955 [Dehalococcoidia bacterium]|nr:hypothetical protein [Dehalococcoidia bacterium]